MAAKEIHWDQNKLYKEIWEKPATQVATEYGISDVGLGKVCRQLNIPKPERGYWRRKGWGLKVRRAPLPAMETVPRVVSSIYEREPEPPMSPSLQALAHLETTPERRIALPNELGEGVHPLVKKTLSALQRGKSSQAGYLQPKAVYLDVTRRNSWSAPSRSWKRSFGAWWRGGTRLAWTLTHRMPPSQG